MFNNSSHIDASHSAFTEVHQIQGNQTTYTVVHGNQIIRLAGEGYSGLDTLHRASTTNAAFDSAQRFPAPSCLPGTRIEILNLISSWLNDDGPQSICWLNGLAGSGKSAIAQTIAEMYAAQHRLVASFFFSRREIERSTTQRFIPTIATHFMSFSPSLKPAIIRALEEDFTIPTKVLREQMMKLLFEPFVSLSTQMTQTDSSTQIKSSPPVLMVIDSLDECDNERLVSEIISLIPQLIQECPFALKVLLTSRPEPHLKAAFRTSEILSVTRSLELRSFDAETDIRLFLQKSFIMIRDQRQSTLFGNSGPWPSVSELEALVQKASGQQAS
ncbi:hypothetical protein BJ138DRAFT_1105908 [Hygrophoropsis aurantiaca]|uniref:Uncharacterized protein n=1 Tax=Hygrophoropsis aurantiaca TaxID=72124 RepID=A0ACB7ZXU8_9AGAM|nr:hypothetical protein BJ138DRAFT_1105908 [Hygrophoropsis aurantiaca]